MSDSGHRDYACVECLHEQKTFAKPCEKCGSRKLEHSAFRRQTGDEHWRELREAEKGREH